MDRQLDEPEKEVVIEESLFVQQKRDALLNIAPENLTPFELLEQEVVAVPELNSNKIIISATEQYYDEVMDLVRELDKRPEMVICQCLIASLGWKSIKTFSVRLSRTK